MNLYLTKQAAQIAASGKEIEAARLALDRRHSSGYRYKQFRVRRQFFVLWQVYEVK